ncbi:LysR family transcriptional regulator [Mesorhizobium sp.]|uniref:LysR family transcriptional regulator n=1 Tax=Mesorhizobium sp. TaxID=1871066 RepID=UPI000FE65448|nr:LysR family transcriptional regulator [Mesorhizobium sp.]RWQ15347.1 MAG: LysR family transcriptional regulator [Mesorhizobium sp.]
MLSLRQFQQFLAVAEAMSFRRAAERLNMAQPPLTAAIRLMEEELGVKLFERTNRIDSLTVAGEVLREEAQRTIVQAERAMALTRRAGAGEIGSLRIGFVASAVRQLLPTLIAAFRESHPGVVLELEEAPTARQVAALLDDRMDIGIAALPLPPSAVQRITVQTMVRDRLVAAIPARHKLALAPDDPIALAALANEPWILFPPNEGPGLHSTILHSCAQAGFTPRVAQRAVQMETIVGLVAAGLGVALVPGLFGEAGREGVVFRDLAGAGSPIPYEVALAWRTGNNRPALEAFIRTGHRASDKR